MHRAQKPHKHTKPTTLHTKQTKHTHTHCTNNTGHTELSPDQHDCVLVIRSLSIQQLRYLQQCWILQANWRYARERTNFILLPKNAVNKLSSYSQTNSLANQYSLYTMKSMLKLIYRAPIQVYNNTVCHHAGNKACSTKYHGTQYTAGEPAKTSSLTGHLHQALERFTKQCKYSSQEPYHEPVRNRSMLM